LRDLRMPLKEPYPSAIATLTNLETLLVVVATDDGSYGFGEAAIVEGYTHETRKGGWEFCRQHARDAIDRSCEDVINEWMAHRAQHSHAVAAMVSAVEMAMSHPALSINSKKAFVPLLAPVNSKSQKLINAEIDRLIAEGFKTLKVKVGFNVEQDLKRLEWIQARVSQRASIRLDGNQGYSLQQALEFIEKMSTESIELFEQPCLDSDWGAAQKISQTSPVPMMLDESIYVVDDILKAARMRAAQFIKLKLVKSGGLTSLLHDLQTITDNGMCRVLGNGVASEVGCWMEACIAYATINNAGEFNGFLKTCDRLFEQPLSFENGGITIPAGYWPALNMSLVDKFTVMREQFR